MCEGDYFFIFIKKYRHFVNESMVSSVIIEVNLIMNFRHLIDSIKQTHTALQEYAGKAINKSLTIRNWLIGFYIVEFEQHGEDRAKYGEKLVTELAKKIGIRGLGETNLKTNRQFYLLYPQLRQVLADELKRMGLSTAPIRQLLTDEFYSPENQSLESGSVKSDILQISPSRIIDKLSYTHLVQLFSISNPIKRLFYETECIKGHWTVAELKRQINSLYFERSGLSKAPEKLSGLVAEKAESLQPADIIKSVYTFEFLGLPAKDVVEEQDLEKALLDNLQDFMLELGHGFCLEARQKRILIGNDYFSIDLVFYHRILKCHVLIDLKVEEFSHANAGQLNTYLNYYKAEVQLPHDNPPVGILLVTNKNKTLVEYATAGMDQRLFVSKYLVELPSKEQLEDFVQNEIKHLN